MITRIFFISKTSFSPIIFTFPPPFVTINHKAKACPKTFRKKGETVSGCKIWCVNFENGMGISVGRLREDTVYDWKFVGLSHNTVRGAAGGAVLCAETLKAKGYIQAK